MSRTSIGLEGFLLKTMNIDFQELLNCRLRDIFQAMQQEMEIGYELFWIN
jgi:hypothetical protein